MRWQRVIGQEHAKEILISAIRRDRIAHAYCLWGPEGVGKDALAIEFARVLNCSEPIVSTESIEACSRCKDCLQMSNLQHPNVRLVFSLPAAGKGSDDDSPLVRLSDDHIALIQEQLALKAHDPYHDISIPNATQIRIASIRDVRRTLQLSAPLAHGWRVVIISEADAMTIEAANAFLKTLEEPHARTTLILTTSRRDQLPPTILSRCQQIHCGALSDDDIAAALVERENVSLDRARVIAALAQGSFRRAVELVRSSQDDDSSELALTFLRTALKPSRYQSELHGLIERRIATLDRQQIAVVLRLLVIWLNDAYRLRTLSDASRYLAFREGDAATALRRFIERYTRARLDDAIEAVERAIAALESNAQVPLALVALAVRLRRTIGQTTSSH